MLLSCSHVCKQSGKLGRNLRKEDPVMSEIFVLLINLDEKSESNNLCTWRI